MIRLLENLKKALKAVVGKGSVDGASKGAKGIEADIVLLGKERHSGIRVMQHYGFASVPKKGFECVALFVGGARDNGVCVATQGTPSKIPALAAGEVAIFSEFGQTVVLDKDGNIQVDPASGKDIIFNGRVIARNDVISEGKLLAVDEVAAKVIKAGSSYTDLAAVHLSTHTHPVSGNATTGPVPGS